MKAVPLRSRSFTTLFRADPLTPRALTHPKLLPLPIRTTFFSPHRTLAQVQPTHDLFNDAWFTGSGPAKLTPEECGLKPSGPQPDDRTLKLGKSAYSPYPYFLQQIHGALPSNRRDTS